MLLSSFFFKPWWRKLLFLLVPVYSALLNCDLLCPISFFCHSYIDTKVYYTLLWSFNSLYRQIFYTELNGKNPCVITEFSMLKCILCREMYFKYKKNLQIREKTCHVYFILKHHFSPLFNARNILIIIFKFIYIKFIHLYINKKKEKKKMKIL